MSQSMNELLERYEATGDEDVFVEAKRLYEEALAEAPDPLLLRDYGYLLECHGRYAIQRAAEQYERSIELDPGADKPHYQVISAQAALGNADDAVALYERRVAASPEDVREYRFLASAHLAARDHQSAARVIDAGP